MYTNVSRRKCSPLLHKNVYSALGMELLLCWAGPQGFLQPEDERLLPPALLLCGSEINHPTLVFLLVGS